MTFTRWILYPLLPLLAILGASAFIALAVGHGTHTEIVSAVVASPTGLIDGERPFLYVADVRRALGVSIPAPLPETTSQVRWYGDEGKMLIFTAQQIGQDSTHGLHLFDPRLGDLTRLYTERVADASQVGFYSYRPTFYEDRWLAFVGLEEQAVYVTDLTTGDTRRVFEYPPDTRIIGEASWSPNGAYLAFVADFSDLYIIDLNEDAVYSHAPPPETTAGVIEWKEDNSGLTVSYRAQDRTTTTILFDPANFNTVIYYHSNDPPADTNIGLCSSFSLIIGQDDDVQEPLKIHDSRTGEERTLDPQVVLNGRLIYNNTATTNCEYYILHGYDSRTTILPDELHIIGLENNDYAYFSLIDSLLPIVSDEYIAYLGATETANYILYRVPLDGVFEPTHAGKVPLDNGGRPVSVLQVFDDGRLLVEDARRLAVGALDTDKLTYITPEGLHVVNWQLLR